MATDEEALTTAEIVEIRAILVEYKHRRWAFRQLITWGGIFLSVVTGVAAIYTAARTLLTGIK